MAWLVSSSVSDCSGPAVRLVIEGGFHPDEIIPHPPLVVENKAGQSRLAFDLAAEREDEQTVLGGLKTKDIDVVVAKPGVGLVIAISVNGTGGALRNLTNRMEEAIGDSTNLHIMYPGLVYAFLHVIEKKLTVGAFGGAGGGPAGYQRGGGVGGQWDWDGRARWPRRLPDDVGRVPSRGAIANFCNQALAFHQRGLAQLEPEARALAGLGFNADPAIHSFDALADQSQTNAGARIRFLGVESLE